MLEINLTNQNFTDEVLNSDKPVLVDFYANWCAPCRMLAPIVEKVAQNHPEIKVGKVNVDEQFQLANAYQVSSIPMLALFKDGRIVNTSLGYVPMDLIEEMIGA